VTAAIHVTSFEPAAGKTVVVLGLVEHLAATAGRVGYLRPVRPVPDDARADLVRSRLQPRAEGVDADVLVDDVVVLSTAAELADLMGEGRTAELVARALEAFHELASRCDVVIVDGPDHTGVVGTADDALDAMLIGDLGTPVLAVVKGYERRPSAVADAIAVAHERLEEIGATHLGTVVNRVMPEHLEQIQDDVTAQGGVAVGVIPDDPMLAAPTASEVFRAIGGVMVQTGRDDVPVDDQRPVTGIRVGAMSMPNLIDRLTEGTLLLTPADRTAVVLATLVADVTPSMPSVAGIVLTGGFSLDPRVAALLQGIRSQVPVCAVDEDTFATATTVAEVASSLHPHQTRKIERALALVAAHVDLDAVTGRMATARVVRVTPRMFERQLVERAATDRKRIVLPEGTDERILRATEIVRARNVAEIVLLGSPDEVRRRAEELGVELGDTPIVDPATDERLAGYAERYRQLRSHKAITADQARDRMTDVSYFATMMVHAGEADGMVSGAAHTTAHTIRPAFEFIRTKPGVDVVSSVFLMCLADRVLVYGDCAVIPNPTADELADIAVASAETARTFGIEPRVAMLSYSTGASGTGSDVERVRAAVSMARERAPQLLLDGPLQYDAAIDPGVAAKKLPDSLVAGRATVFVFPDLDTGNTTYKAVQRSAGAVAIGPVLQGLNAPVNDLSRGCLVADVVNTIAITAIQAQVAAAAASASAVVHV
jgi:phosphate acetyltransferase